MRLQVLGITYLTKGYDLLFSIYINVSLDFRMMLSE